MLKKAICILAFSMFALSFLALIQTKVAHAQTPTVEIVNPGPDGYTLKWNASTVDRGFGSSDFLFYSNETAIGSTFFMNITIHDVQNCRGWGIGVVYDNTTLKYVSAWRPSDHVFEPVEEMGWTIVAPAPTVDAVNETHGIVKWGLTYIIPEGETPWTFNGSGILGQIQFKIINCAAKVTTADFVFDPDWTDVYYYPSGSEKPTMGVGHFEYTDNDLPVISTPVQNPLANNVQAGQSVNVFVNVTDQGSGVKNVTLYYRNDTTPWYSVPMTFNSTSGSWEATIPGHALGTNIAYYIEAYDNVENYAKNDNATGYYTYSVIPEFSPYAMMLILVLATASVMLVMLSKRWKKFYSKL